MTTVEFIEPLIGKRWKRFTEGPDTFDCWGLVVYVRRHLFNDELPPVERPFEGMELAQARELFERSFAPIGWHRVEKPQEGSIVLLSRYDRPTHVGVFLSVPGSPGRVLHCHEDFGVMYESPIQLRQQMWTRFRYYSRG